MPTKRELADNGFGWLSSRIDKNGGFSFWSERLNLLSKTGTPKEYSILDIESRIEKGINDAKKELLINRMPSRSELQGTRFSWLSSLISRNGGSTLWSKKLNLELKSSKQAKMIDSKIKTSIQDVMKKLKLARMPSSTEITELNGNNILHNNIVRSYGYREWAVKLNLELKDSETQLGNDYESNIVDLLRKKGYQINKMTTNHPFDLLINNSVKVDVKVAKPHMLRGESRVHAFATNKRFGSCDLYIAVALSEQEEIEKILIIPSHRLQIVTLCIGKNSKYDVYKNRFDLIDKYSQFFEAIK